MLLIVEPPEQRASRTLEEGQALYAQMMDYVQDLKTRGQLISAESLTSLRDAVRVSAPDGKQRVIDGPFSEAKEMVGGFVLVDCATREEAIAIAARCPAARFCTIEVRTLGPCYVH